MNRMSVADAARVLGVSVQAIHGRIKRGTLEHEKGEDGLTYVYVDNDKVESIVENEVENGVENGLYNRYISALTSEIESLKRDRDEWRDEAKRHQHIIASMNQTMNALIHRVPELEASPEATEAHVTNNRGEGKGSVPPKPENGTQRLSWWRRILQ